LRIISKSRLRDFWRKHPDAEAPLLEWYKAPSRANGNLESGKVTHAGVLSFPPRLTRLATTVANSPGSTGFGMCAW
jgi:hypothetical protein